MKESQGKVHKAINIFLDIVIVVLVLACISLFFIQTYQVSKTSMMPTISDGQKVLILKGKNVERGDIVIWEDEDIYDKVLVKRVVAVGGDTISINGGILSITYQDKNGETQAIVEKESYVYNNIEISPYVVPQGEIYLLGDNRKVSIDSSEFGSVNADGVIGKVIKILN